MMRTVIFVFGFMLSMKSMAVNIKEFGAKGDGLTLNTEIIQHAIDQTAARGGGEVLIPSGRFLSGSIILKSNITLRLEKGAVLLASRRLDDFKITPSDYVSHINRYTERSLIFAQREKNISIVGEGCIDGQGHIRNWPVDKLDKWTSLKVRPYMIRIISCDSITVQGIVLKNSPGWMQHYLHCSNMTIDAIKVFNHGNYNNDGLDIDNCRNVTISNSRFDVDDDAICFKTTNSVHCVQNVSVANCVIASNCNAIKFGTETNGGFRNVSISNCAFYAPSEPTIYDRSYRALGGIVIESVDGGMVEGINIMNITMDGVMTPIFIRLANRGRNFYEGGPSQLVGMLRNVSISNVYARMNQICTSSITGIEGHRIENITLSNIHFVCEGNGRQEDANRRRLDDREKSYPETLRFIDSPAYGLYLKNVDGIRLNNVRFEALKADPRAGIYAHQVSNLSLSFFTMKNPHLSAPMLLADDCQNVFVSHAEPSDKAPLLIRVEGDRSDRIFVSDIPSPLFDQEIVNLSRNKKAVLRY